MKEHSLRVVLFLCLVMPGHVKTGAAQQVLARFTVRNIQCPIAAPVSVPLDGLTQEADTALLLQEIKGKERIPVPFQVEHGNRRSLWWMVKKEGKTTEKIFELVRKKAQEASPAIKVEDRQGALVVTDQGREVLQYNYRIVEPPEDVDTVFRRSGFIHPLWSPAGNVLTRIHPWDHRHHFGIWNPWTHTLFEGKTVDFWNLAKKEGTVRFAKFISRSEGPVFGGFKALQEHVVLDTLHGKDRTALNEVWDIRVYHAGDGMWLWDFASRLNCATGSPVLLEKYDYGGFGFRATEAWNKDKSKALTSEGKGRNDGNKTRARWCMIDGETPGTRGPQGRSGILFMSYPANYNFPEPIRIYPENSLFGSGDVFFSFSPVLTTSWLLSPGRDHVLRYRMLVYEDTITREQAEQVWQSFAHPPAVTIVKTK